MQAASQLFKTLDPGFLQLSSVGEVRKEIADRYQKIETLSQELLAECKLRNASLRKVRLQDAKSGFKI